MFSAMNFMTVVANDINALAGMFEHYLSGASNLRIISIILMLLAFILFLFLIITLYVKSIISFLKTENKNAAESADEEIDADEFTAEDEEELERELARELEQELEISREQNFRREEEENQTQYRQMQTNEPERAEKVPQKEKSKTNEVDLDWKKGKKPEISAEIPAVNLSSLQYQQSGKSLEELIGLIVDMIGRGVDELKIAQTIMYRNQGKKSEEEIIQTINAIKDFIALCISGKFKGLKTDKRLPAEDEALYHLAMGDSSLALALLEALMDKNIEYSATLPSGRKRDEVFRQTSDYAGTFGTLAALADSHLATGAFELAVELAPQNVNAWSRLADMYHLLDARQKASWAYQQVLDMADEELYPQSVANAKKILSQYYYAEGNSLQAAKFYNQSKQFYDSIGINRRLDKKEIEIVEIIESHRQQDIEDVIARILSENHLQNSYNF